MTDKNNYSDYVNLNHVTDDTLTASAKWPNGFRSWMETHHEIVGTITNERLSDNPRGLVNEIQEAHGSAAFYGVAEKLTDEFETLHIGRKWDGEFFDEVDEFVCGKLNIK